MKATVTRAFPGVPDGETKTRRIPVGAVLTGDLARVAVANGWAKEERPAPQNKSLDAPENKVTAPVETRGAGGKRAKSSKSGC